MSTLQKKKFCQTVTPFQWRSSKCIVLDWHRLCAVLYRNEWMECSSAHSCGKSPDALRQSPVEYLQARVRVCPCLCVCFSALHFAESCQPNHAGCMHESVGISWGWGAVGQWAFCLQSFAVHVVHKAILHPESDVFPRRSQLFLAPSTPTSSETQPEQTCRLD